MRSLLISLMLIVTVILIYAAVAEGDDGMKSGVGRSGTAMSDYIRGMSP